MPDVGVQAKPNDTALLPPSAAKGADARPAGDSLSDPLEKLELSDELKQTAAEETAAAPAKDATAAAGGQPGATAKEDGAGGGGDGKGNGLAQYEATLGRFLGGNLYKALSPQLTLDKFQGYADQGIKAAFEAAGGKLGDLTSSGDQAAAVEAFAAALAEQYQSLGSEFVKAHPDWFEAVAKWVDGHPATVATLVLLAAGGAVAANMDIPQLKQKLKITDELSAELSASLGKIREISLQKVEASLAYESSRIAASATSTFEAEDAKHTHAVKASAKGDKDTFSLEGKAEFKGADLEAYAVSAAHKKHLKSLASRGDDKDGTETSVGVSKAVGKAAVVSAQVETTNGKTVSTTRGEYDTDSGVFTLKNIDTAAFADGKGTVSAERTASTDGTGSAKVSAERELAKGLTGKVSLEEVVSKAGVDSAYDLTEQQKASFNLKYSTDDLKAQLDAMLSSAGDSTVGGSVEKDLGGGTSAGANLTLGLSDPKLTEMGAFFGFTSPTEYEAWLVKYAYKAQGNEHSLGFRLDEKLGKVYTRVEQKLTLSDLGLQSESSLHGAMFKDDDTKGVGGIAGLRYQVNDRGEHNFIPEAGMQVKGVAILGGYDFQNKGFSVRLTIPFGR